MVHLLLAIIYVSFISLGLPDALLGAAWPTMCQDLGTPVSYAGIIAMIVSLGTIVSSLQSDRMTKWLGTGKVTAFSVAMTAAALWGFSVSTRFWQLCLWAVPYGLGAGSVDASLNNYVALHYTSRDMSWLHCMWGIGASAGPYILGTALTAGLAWNTGYRIISLFQIVLTAVLLLSLPLWKGRGSAGEAGQEQALGVKEVLSIRGAGELLASFFCYCALEQTAILWGSSYLVLHMGMEETMGAKLGSLFLIGITFGRFLSGFMTMKFSDEDMIRLGQGAVLTGIVTMLLPLGPWGAMAGLLLIGFGCAPIYPCIIHATPDHFGAEKSQAIIGVQMATAYIGTLSMPPLFGLIANHISPGLLPWYLLFFLVVMVGMSESLNRKCRK